jgi:anhydro-N-acetylmuramic acid kinase
MKILESLSNKDTRRIVGLISGTSADGVDAALLEIEEKNGFVSARLIHALTLEYPEELQKGIREIGNGNNEELCDLNYILGEIFASAALSVIEKGGLEPADCHLIGSHGQTVCHRPGVGKGATLQIGEASVIAERTGIVTVSDFRAADIAAGGEGAPLVPLADYYLMRPEEGIRLLLNIGGIANLTILTPEREGVSGFDTGPGNALIDSAVRTLTDNRILYDEEGRIAERGKFDSTLLTDLMRHPYIDRKPPKSTGLEMFGDAYLKELLNSHADLGMEDIVATLTHFTARSIARAVKDFVRLEGLEKTLYVGGGGAHNKYLMKILGEEIGSLQVRKIEELGVPVDYREAIAFAVLANETLEGRPGNISRVTGARREVILGKISIP